MVPLFLTWMFECIKFCVDSPEQSLDVHADARKSYVKGMASGYVLGFGSAANLASVFVYERALQKAGANDQLRKTVMSTFTYGKWWPLLQSFMITLGVVTSSLFLCTYLLAQTKKNKIKHAHLITPYQKPSPVIPPPSVPLL